MSDQDIEKAIAEIVQGGDLETLSVKKVQAQLAEKFGQDVVKEKKSVIKAKVVDEAQRCAAKQEEAEKKTKREEEEEGAGEEEEEEKKNAKKRGKSSKKSGRESKIAKVEEAYQDVPVNVEVEMKVEDFVRRNPSRAGRKAAAPVKARKPRKKKAEGEGEGEKKKKKTGFNKPMGLSVELQEFMGVPMAARSEVSKKIHDYIKEHNLKDPKDGRNILLDETLQKVFKGRKKTTYFKMNAHLTPLLYKPEEVVNDVEEEESVDVELDEEEGKEKGNEEDKEDGKEEEKNQNVDE